MAQTVIGLGAESVKKDSTKEIKELTMAIAEKDKVIAKKDEEISGLKKKIAELEKGGSDDGTTPENSGRGTGKSKTK